MPWVGYEEQGEAVSKKKSQKTSVEHFVNICPEKQPFCGMKWNVDGLSSISFIVIRCSDFLSSRIFV